MSMLFDRPDDEVLYDALLARDPAYEGFAYAAVRTTGVFCRLTCPARKPKRGNVRFFASVAQCLEAGYRPCQRCRPLSRPDDPDPVVARLLDALAREPERRWRESDLAALGYDASTVRRAFKRRFGISFLEMARLRRVGQAAGNLASGASVIDAQLDAGFESGSGFRAAFARLFGDAPARLRGRELLCADWLETPLGAMLAVADRHALHLLEFADRRALASEIRTVQRLTGSAIAMGRLPPIDDLARDLSRYFYGCLDPSGVRLAGYGTPFEREVWEALRRIPAGTTRSYGDIARAVGRPGAARAVARANGANRFAVIVPCHRVVGGDGALTGYGGGLWRKRWLLEHERRIAARESGATE